MIRIEYRKYSSLTGREYIEWKFLHTSGYPKMSPGRDKRHRHSRQNKNTRISLWSTLIRALNDVSLTVHCRLWFQHNEAPIHKAKQVSAYLAVNSGINGLGEVERSDGPHGPLIYIHTTISFFGGPSRILCTKPCMLCLPFVRSPY